MPMWARLIAAGAFGAVIVATKGHIFVDIGNALEALTRAFTHK